MNPFDRYKSLIARRLAGLLAESGADPLLAAAPPFTLPPSVDVGHISLPCFSFAKPLKKSPALIAEDFAKRFPREDGVRDATAAGPYLNFHLDLDSVAKVIAAEVDDNRFYANESRSGQTIMVEFSSPNTNKPLHLGHGRNNLLGRTVAELLKLSGAEVIKANLVNDRGIHICKSMLAYRKFGQGETPQSAGKKGDHLVGDYYVLYAQNENEALKTEAAQMLVDWENGKPDVIELWKKMRDWALEGIEQTYRRTDIRFHKLYRESETYEGGRQRVLEALGKGLCQKEENGAVSIDLEEEKLGKKILLRADGTTVYITQDINTTLRKFEDYPLTGSIFVVGNEQEHHFKVLFAVLKKFGFAWAKDCQHLSYGMIELPEGKMKSREGKVVDLDNLLDELKSLSLGQLAEREKTRNTGRTEGELEETAERIGQAALNYFVLKTAAAKNIVFQPEESLSFEGNTGPYLQYTHARIATMLAKAGFTQFAFPAPHSRTADEENITLILLRASDAIKKAAAELNPALLANYAYDLAKAYNKFYAESPMLRAEEESVRDARLSLSLAVKRVLAKTLRVLGIHPIESM